MCFTIPIDNDRLFEKGAEKFLQSLAKGELEGCKYVQHIKCKREILAQLLLVPIIAIFTKYDRLDTRIRRCREFAGLDEQALQEEVDNKFNELCIRPFREQVNGLTREIPAIPVSTRKDYKLTLHKLIRLTTEAVERYFPDYVVVVSAVAQQISPTVKLDAVIA